MKKKKVIKEVKEVEITEILTINVSPTKEYTIQGTIKSIEKGQLRIFLD